MQPPVELELFIYLKEMKVGSDLAGTIRCIGNIDLHSIFSFIDKQFIIIKKYSPGVTFPFG